MEKVRINWLQTAVKRGTGCHGDGSGGLKARRTVRNHIRSTEATYDIQFGNVKRSTHWNTSWDYVRFESVGHQWADLSERGYGVSVLNDCKYGYDIKDSVIRLSLIKCSTHPDYRQDQGNHEFTYSLLPREGELGERRNGVRGVEVKQPAYVCKWNCRPGRFLSFPYQCRIKRLIIERHRNFPVPFAIQS